MMQICRKGSSCPLNLKGASRLIVFLVLALFVCAGFAKQSDKKGRQIALRLEPGPDNPRNSEGDFVTLKDGRILFVYSHYVGNSGGDHDPAYLAGRISENGGKSWSSEDLKILENEGTMNVMSVSLLRMNNGEIALFYLRKNSTTDCLPMVRFSKDEASTWSDPISCIGDKTGYFVLNNSRVIQLKNGRILLTVHLYKTPAGSQLKNGSLWSYYSDDNGRTWTSGVEVANPNNFLTQEPGVVELKNGDIQMYIRSDIGFLCTSLSQDRGVTWSPVAKSNIKSPVAPVSVKRILSTGDLLMVWNNNGGEDPQIKGKRTPLTLAISKDEGKSWGNIRNIEVNPNGWYCYTAIHFIRKDVLLGYCAGDRTKGNGLASTQITKMSIRSIYH